MLPENLSNRKQVIKYPQNPQKQENSVQKLKTISKSFKYEGVIAQKNSFKQYAEKLTELTEQPKKKHKKQRKKKKMVANKNEQQGDKLTN